MPSTDPKQTEANGPRRPDLRRPSYSEAQLDQLAEITPEDIARAVDAWRKYTDRRWHNLLIARSHRAPPDEE